MKDNEYQCAVCGGIFEKGWSEEEARAEEAEVFGGNDPDIIDFDKYRSDLFERNTLKD